MKELYLALGSNEGDRKALLMEAISMMDKALGTHAKASSIIETKAQGFEGGSFLNMAIKYEIADGGQNDELFCMAILTMAKDIEKALGRTGVAEYDANGGRIYHDRPIDIDILLYDSFSTNSQKLTIPHPRMAERDFVMVPLREIASDKIMALWPYIFNK